MHIQISICTCLYVHKHIHTDIMSGAWCSSARWTGAERCCCTQIYACPRVCGCVHARTHAHTHTHTYTHTHTCTHARTHACMHACMDARVHVHAHTHILKFSHWHSR